MTAICKSSIKAKAIRVVKLDECGNPVAGAQSLAVSEGFVQLTLTPDIEDGQEYLVKTANGDLCINDKDSPRLKRYNIELELCAIDPDVINLMTGGRRITRAGSPASAVEAIGSAVGEDDETNGFSLEVWTKIAGGDCAGGNDRYFQWVLPWVRNAILGALTFEQGPLSVTINADTLGNANYGQGPFNDFEAPIGATEHLAWQITSDAPPAGACGFQSLILA